jgi:hypothetical protein
MADDFFGDWMQWQFTYSPESLTSMNDHLNEFFIDGFKTKFDKHRDNLKPLMPFLTQFYQGLISSDGQMNLNGNLDACRQNCSQVYDWLDTNPAVFFNYLKNNSLFTSEQINQEERDADVNVSLEKYKSFAKLLFACPNKQVRGAYLFSLADKLFKWCFSPEHWGEFRPYLQDPKNHQVARFVYSNVWNYLVGRGWKDWNTSTLGQLKQKTVNGGKVVYIAGGTDILQLLKNGNYNIQVIDPFLPSQSRYYSDPLWERWVKGAGKNFGRGDRVMFDFGSKKIVLVRRSFKKVGDFEATLSTGDVRKLEKSMTEWDVVEAKGKYLGKVVFERRFANQGDFVEGKNRVVLMSFNEMYYAFQPTVDNGWGMDLKKLSQNFKIYVKQLSFPVNRGYLNVINESEKIDFDFIRLGSCFR